MVTLKQKKALISLRLNEDLLAWFKQQQSKGYQTLIQSVLENYMQDKNLKLAHSAGRAQEIFRQFHTQCFWHYAPDLKISEQNIQLVIDGLRKHGGRSGLLLAEELCQ